MKTMTLAVLIKEHGSRLLDCYLTEVEIEEQRVTRVIDTHIIDEVLLCYAASSEPKIFIETRHFVSATEADIAIEQGAETAPVDMVELELSAATTAIILPNGTVWFRDLEEGQYAYWCIHNTNHPILPGDQAARMG